MFGTKKLLFSVALLLTFSVTAWGQSAVSKTSKAQLRNGIAAASTLAATNGILTVSIDSGSGQFTIETGAQHPQPNQTVFFPIGTSYITLRDAVDKVMLHNSDFFSPSVPGLAGYTIASLVDASTTTVALGTTGFRTTYTVANWKVEQDVVINGTTLNDSNVRHSVTVTNTTNASRQFGLRYLWDWQIAGEDGSVFRTRLPDTNFSNTFQTFSPPQFKLYEEVDNPANPTFSIFGSVRDLPLNPAPTLPDQVRYCDWVNSVDSAWDFANTGANFDSAVCYYWGFNTPLDLAAGGSTTFTQYVTTQLGAIAPGLTVAKTAPPVVNSGSNLVYNFTVLNNGNGPATNVVLSDTIPAGTTFVSSTGGINPVVNNGVFTVTLPDIAPQGQATATLTVKVNATSGNIVNQTYSVSTTGGSTATGIPVTTRIFVLPPPGPLAGIIAFSSSRDGNNEIYTMDTAGKNLMRLTNDRAVDDQPNISRDGKRIVFSSLRDGQREIYVMSITGTNLVRLTFNAYDDYQPQFSPDGTKIVFTSTRNGNPEIYVMNAGGTGQTRLTLNDGVDDHPSFSGDGKLIVFHSYRLSNHEIYRMNADGTAVKRLTNVAGTDTNPSYSPDGTLILFQSNRVRGQNEIYLMKADGTSQKRITFNAGNDTLPCFSPDGTRIAFSTTRGVTDPGDNEIALATLAGEQVSGAQALTRNVNDDSGPSWGKIAATGGISASIASNSSQDAGSSQAVELSAEASSSSLTLSFAGTAPQGAADMKFTVSVNGKAAVVQSITVRDNSVVLVLADGSLSSGAAVSVSFEGHEGALTTTVP